MLLQSVKVLQYRSINLILTGLSGTADSFWTISSGSWWYSKWNRWIIYKVQVFCHMFVDSYYHFYGPCFTRTGNYQIHEFDWLTSILTAVWFSHLDQLLHFGVKNWQTKAQKILTFLRTLKVSKIIALLKDIECTDSPRVINDCK